MMYCFGSLVRSLKHWANVKKLALKLIGSHNFTPTFSILIFFYISTNYSMRNN